MNHEGNVESFLAPRSFGRGRFLGNNPAIDNLTSKQRLKVSAWRHACPRPGEVSSIYGLEWTRKRYDECDFVFSSIICELAKEKPSLFKQLTTPVPRLPDEPVGVSEPSATPPAHKYQMSPLSTLWGYALPRVFIEIAGRGEKRNPERYLHAVDVLKNVIFKSENPYDLLARLSTAATRNQADPAAVLGHVLEPGILQEENCRNMYRQVIANLKVHAPRLWQYYQGLSFERREKLGILPNPATLNQK